MENPFRSEKEEYILPPRNWKIKDDLKHQDTGRRDQGVRVGRY